MIKKKKKENYKLPMSIMRDDRTTDITMAVRDSYEQIYGIYSTTQMK